MKAESTIEAVKDLLDGRKLTDDTIVLDAIEAVVYDKPALPPEMPSWLRMRVRRIA